MQHPTPSAALLAAIGLAVCVLVAGGCGSAGLNYKPGARSILDFQTGPDYSRAAIMARNPYSASDRFSGTLTLVGAPFASEDIYLGLFETNITDRDESVRMAACRGLANHGTPEHALLLATALDDPSDLVRVEAARGLQRIHNPEAVPALQRRCVEQNEPDAAVRAECAHALGQYAEHRVLQQLVRVLREDPSLAVNASALSALRALTGEDFGLSASGWSSWIDQTTEPFANRVMYTYRYFHRSPTLIERLPFVPGPPNEVRASPAGLLPRG